MEQQKQHFLVVSFPAQGHINPNRSLAGRLAKTTGARVTFSTAVSAHRLMFPSIYSPEEETSDGLVTYKPYSDGYDHGVKWFEDDLEEYKKISLRVGSATLSSIIDDQASRSRPVTFIIYSMQMYWVKEVALLRDIPIAFYWIQPAAVFGIYYHYFHGNSNFGDLIASHSDDPSFLVKFPHLPPLKISDLPSFFTNEADEALRIVIETIRLTIESLLKPGKHGEKPTLLMNTFEELEAEAIKSLKEIEVEILPIGPDIPSSIKNDNEMQSGDLFKSGDKDYIEWLDMKPEKSVVYVSFGSISTMSKQKLEEIQRGLKASRRPYLWVVRKDNREEIKLEEENHNAMVVEWCDQIKVLSHPSIGCFVTHCGWNSTLESLTCGIPMLAVPQWSDQHTSARMVAEWGVGVRGEVNNEGVLEGEMLNNGLEMIMGRGGRGVEMRRRCEIWRYEARETITEGSSRRNFEYFLEKFARF